jgi:hypothetical protein
MLVFAQKKARQFVIIVDEKIPILGKNARSVGKWHPLPYERTTAKRFALAAITDLDTLKK